MQFCITRSNLLRFFTRTKNFLVFCFVSIQTCYTSRDGCGLLEDKYIYEGSDDESESEEAEAAKPVSKSKKK